jgi:hypothetical protein
MGAILSAIGGGLVKFIPFLGPVLNRFFDTEKAAELRAQKELIEARAFAKGRISPKYFFLYALAAIMIVYSAVILIAVFFPGVITGSEHIFESIKGLIELGNEAFSGGM